MDRSRRTARTAARTLAALGASLLVMLAVRVPADAAGAVGGARADGLAARADWLTTLNWYRTASGVAPVAEEWPWNDAVRSHLRYLAHTPKDFRTGEFASDHTENPASPRWTSEGERAAKAGNYGSGASEREAIENWMVAPFHAIGMLRPNLTRVGFALESGRAGIDVVRGVVSRPRPTAPVLFPGHRATVMLTRLPPQGELPDPRSGCPAGASWTGLPLLALLPSLPPVGTWATMTLPDGSEIASPQSLCVQTAASYRPGDPVYGPTGTSLLRNDRAVIILPPEPLRIGTHTVVLHLPGRPDVTWSFTVAGEPPPSRIGATPSADGRALRVAWDRPVDRLTGSWFEIARTTGPAPESYRYLGDASWTDVASPLPGESADIMVRSCSSQQCSEPVITRVDVLLPAAPEVTVSRVSSTAARITIIGEQRTLMPIDDLRITTTVIRNGRAGAPQSTQTAGRVGSSTVSIGSEASALRIRAVACAAGVCGPATEIERTVAATRPITTRKAAAPRATTTRRGVRSS